MSRLSPSPSRTARPWIYTMTALAIAVGMAACSKDKGEEKDAEPKSTQVAAKVNKEELSVHQINFLMAQQRNIKPEQVDQAQREILERLIDQELAVQKAAELKLTRDPRVTAQIEAARRDIIARAYLEKVGEAASKPTPEEIKKYYDENPALFSERRLYSLQELVIEAKPDQIEGLRQKLAAAKNINEFAEQLKAADIKFAGNQAMRAAEQLPLASLKSFAAMKDGQAMFQATPNGAQVVFLAGSRPQPVDEVRARPAIEAFLTNERKRKLIADDIKAMRDAAKIEYVGKFTAPASAPAAAPAPAAAASNPDADALKKGVSGLK